MEPHKGQGRWGLLLTVVVLATALPSCARPSVVQVQAAADGWQLLRDGQPYTIRGAGGGASKALLRQYGGNSFRTWGADNVTPQLDEAQQLGLTVTVGIWLGHKEHGFDWHNAQQVQEQFERARRNVLAYRDHPALLCWALGNEMEQGGLADDPVLWQSLEALAKMVKELDPNHPTMTVVAEVGGKTIANLHQYCPSLDIVGINSYAGAASLPERYPKAGGTKPYVVTEFGPPGTWEFWKKAPWGAMDELTSTEKVEWYVKPYQANVVANARHCLGAYAFTWGSKQEASATWFGLLLPDGTKLGAVDALSAAWTGQPAPAPCPVVQPLAVTGPRQLPPGSEVKVALSATDPSGDALTVHWLLTGEPQSYNTGGEAEAAPPTYPDAVIHADLQGATLKLPGPGRYRLFAYVRNQHQGAAMANLAFLVTGGTTAPTVTAPATPGLAGSQAPGLAVYDEDGARLPWIPSGYMGNTGAISLEPACTEQPHGGQTCLKATYGAADGWGGVVWQDPANDWGKLPGGHDLTGATRLSFWARGAAGGEVVSFSFGTLGPNLPFHDSAKAELKDVSLSKEWKLYGLDVAGRDLRSIKSGFVWTVASKGAPVTFYLDDIRWEGVTALKPAQTPAQAAPGAKAALPATVYDEAGAKPLWIPSGYMGNTGAVKLDPECADQPHAGKTCLKVAYAAADNWAGVVWQDPANDWKGEQPGGHDVTGATRLTFWARGAKGGEKVSFSFGLIGRDGKYADTAKGELKDVVLETGWKQYHLDLAGKDLTRVKTGFCWVVAGQGAPLTFYLDDVRYE